MDRYLVDDILQVFDIDANKHFIFGVANGEVLPNGQDVRVPEVTLIVPHARIPHMAQLFSEIGRTLTELEITSDSPANASDTMQASQEDWLGKTIAVIPT